MTDDNKSKAERIAKVMARAGLCSRREAERWIAEGRVQVNGAIIPTPATLVSDDDQIIVDGKVIAGKEKTRLFLYHKPAGLVTTHKDEQGRPTVFENLPAELPRLISVGRLDINTEGLLLLTNDGALSRYMELPQNKMERVYRVRAYGRPSESKFAKIKKGVRVDGTIYKADQIELEKIQGDNTWLTLTLSEGKNREVRKMLEAVDLKVNRLIRTSYGPFHLGNLPKGSVLEIKTKMLKDHVSGFFKK